MAGRWRCGLVLWVYLSLLLVWECTAAQNAGASRPTLKHVEQEAQVLTDEALLEVADELRAMDEPGFWERVGNGVANRYNTLKTGVKNLINDPVGTVKRGVTRTVEEVRENPLRVLTHSALGVLGLPAQIVAPVIAENMPDVVKDALTDISEVTLEDLLAQVKEARDFMKEKYEEAIEHVSELSDAVSEELRKPMWVRFMRHIADKLEALARVLPPSQQRLERIKQFRDERLTEYRQDLSNEQNKLKWINAETKFRIAFLFAAQKKLAVKLARLIRVTADKGQEIADASIPQLWVEGGSMAVSGATGGVERVYDFLTGEIVFFKYAGLRAGTGLVSLLDICAYAGGGFKGTAMGKNLGDAYSGYFKAFDFTVSLNIEIAKIGVGVLGAVSAPTPESPLALAGNLLAPYFFHTIDWRAVKTAAIGVSPDLGLALTPGGDIGVNVAMTCYAPTRSPGHRLTDKISPGFCAKTEMDFVKKLLFLDPMVAVNPLLPLLKVGLWWINRHKNRFNAPENFPNFQCSKISTGSLFQNGEVRPTELLVNTGDIKEGQEWFNTCFPWAPEKLQEIKNALGNITMTVAELTESADAADGGGGFAPLIQALTSSR